MAGTTRWISIETLHDRLIALSLKHDYHVAPGDHDGAYWTQHVTDYLAFYARDWLE